MTFTKQSNLAESKMPSVNCPMEASPPLPSDNYSNYKGEKTMLNHKGTPIFETARLLLRPFCADDGESCLRNWAKDPEVFRHLSQVPHTLESVAE